MKLLLAFASIFLLSLPVQASECQDLLQEQLSEDRIQKMAQQMAERQRQIFSLNVRDGYDSKNNPLYPQYQEDLEQLRSVISDIDQRIVDVLGGSQQAELIEENLQKEKAKKHKRIHHYMHEPIFDSESPLQSPKIVFKDPIRFHRVLPKNDTNPFPDYWEFKDFGSKVVRFTLPIATHKIKGGTSFQREYYHMSKLLPGYALDVPVFGPLRVIKYDSEKNAEAKVIGTEVNKTKTNRVYAKNTGQGRKFTVLPLGENHFILSFENKMSQLWYWNTSGDIKFLKNFEPQKSRFEGRPDNSDFDSACLLSDRYVITAKSNILYLWDISQNKRKVTPLGQHKVYHANALEHLMPVDENHFLSFHNSGAVVLWAVQYYQHGSYSFERVSIMGESLTDLKNFDLSRGHFSNPQLLIKGRIRAAALIEKNHLLTASEDGRLILWRFTLRGGNRIVETFPNLNPAVVDGRIKADPEHMHVSDLRHFRYEVDDQGYLWIESQDLGDHRILWQPVDVGSEEEL